MDVGKKRGKVPEAEEVADFFFTGVVANVFDLWGCGCQCVYQGTERKKRLT